MPQKQHVKRSSRRGELPQAQQRLRWRDLSHRLRTEVCGSWLPPIQSCRHFPQVPSGVAVPMHTEPRLCLQHTCKSHTKNSTKHVISTTTTCINEHTADGGVWPCQCGYHSEESPSYHALLVLLYWMTLFSISELVDVHYSQQVRLVTVVWAVEELETFHNTRMHT